ncbi:pseudouridine synthase [Bdellovibrionota bacterium FG-1]
MLRSKNKPGYVPLERALSKLGLASRTQARRLILAGEVRVNGVLRRDPTFAVFPEKARIELGGEIAKSADFKAFVLNKPRGVMTTHRDEKNRPTVFDLFAKEKLHLIAVGRLDWATSGLLILTNQTQLAAWLTDPKTGILRTYLVTVRGTVAPDEITHLCAGLEDRGESLCAERILLRKASGKESHLTVELREGKNREIRRMFASIGHEVTRLKRVAYGPLELGDLQPGAYRVLSMEEIQRIFPEFPYLNGI